MRRKMTAFMLALMLLARAHAQSTYIIDVQGMAALVDGAGNIIIRKDDADTLIELRQDELYAVGTQGDYALYDADGNRLGDERYEMLEASGDVLLYRQNGRCGAMDLRGNTLIEPEWAQLTFAGEGAFLALEGDLYDDQPDEMISLSIGGNPLNTGSFTANGLHGFHDNRMAFMQSDGQYGFVDALGRQVIPPQWQYAGDFLSGVAMISDGFGLGLIDTEGQIVLAPEYDWIQRGQGILAAHSEEGRLEVYAANGAELLYSIDQTVDEAEVCGAYAVARQANVARLYDESGLCIYESTRSTLFYPGLDGQVIEVNGSWGDRCQRLLNADGGAASDVYQRLLPLCGGRYAFLTFSEANAADTRYGLLSADGRELLSAEYLEIRPSGEDRLVLVEEDAVIFADMDGNALREWSVTGTEASNSEAGV